MEALKLANAKQEPPPPVKPSSAGHEDKSEEPKARASILEFKKVNEVWDKKEYKYKVVELLTPPDKVNELDHYIFIVRTRIDKETKNQIQYIDIKSPGLRDILRKVLQDAQGICLHEEKPSVEQSLLYHYLSDLEECCQDPSAALDPSALEHLGLLLDFIRTAYASTIECLGPLLEKHQITYDLLWTLFKPNNLAYEFGEEKKTKDGVEYFHVKARYLDFDGKMFGETSSEHAIEKFRGAKQITALEVFPLKYHPGERHVRAKLSEFGRKFLSMMDIHLCEYKGKAFYIERGRVVEIFVESRVVVDPAYFREENPNYTRPSIKESNRGPPPPLSSWTFIDLDEIDEEGPSPAKGNGMDPSEVKGDDLLICSPTVPGFSLGNSRWVELAVADIKEIDWKQAALDDLHIPAKKKKAAQALSEAHVKRASTNAFDDVVKGKGQGFNVLLHGPPGVGKTLTAELLAEHLQRPLMQVSAGELGTTAEAVEQRLSRIFKRAARWNAVLLLDEADVLLEQRSSQDIHRNALVCVFLRTLEYYQGMMFLTTNRVGQIDNAIASRIHFKLKYDKLNLEQRTNIWRRFLEKAATPQGEPIYSQDAFDDWVRKARNGREIKNLVFTAHALATQERCQVTMSHLEVAIAACEDFECDFKGAGPKEAMNSYF
ncbi:P-loop containing nucleoside triphosphate hydrolase protein [Hyaloscypha finlandica]|nr:P-loop containing nucleoside triphosphate hydrolase protein [Hyaloscypha finlandica]